MRRCSLARAALVIGLLRLFCSRPEALLAGDVSYFGVIKGVQYEQTNQPTPQLLSTNAYVFTAFVVGYTNNSVTNATVKPSNSATLRQLTMDSNQLSWIFEERFQTQAALDSAYPIGSAWSPVNYTVSMYGQADGLRTSTMNFYILFVAVSYPPVPEITNLTAAAAIDTTRDFCLQWKSLGGSQLSIVQLSILDLSSNIVFLSPVPFQPGALDGTSTSTTIPANTLPPGRVLVGNLSVGNPGVPDTSSYSGATGVPALGRSTEFRLITRPAPSRPVAQITSVVPAIKLAITGETNRLYQVEASTDLFSWTNIGSIFASTMPTNFSDPLSIPGRFYRLRVGDY